MNELPLCPYHVVELPVCLMPKFEEKRVGSGGAGGGEGVLFLKAPSVKQILRQKKISAKQVFFQYLIK